jgi:hypothetical protein
LFGKVGLSDAKATITSLMTARLGDPDACSAFWLQVLQIEETSWLFTIHEPGHNR